TDLHDLTLVEAAILAGLPQRPSAYNPYVNPDLMEKRVDTVLKLMVRHGKISEEEAEEARQEDIPSLLAGKQPNTIPYEGFIQKVRKEVEEKLDANIDTDGLKVYTTLDNSIQEHVEFLLTNSDDNPIPYPDDEMQNGMVVVDTQSGAIRAIGGRRNSEGLGEFNYAYQGGGFQPGSTVKPIISYGPAIEYNKISTYHQINDDKPYKVSGSSEIRNWNRQYQGWMSARYALTHSLNVPTVKLLEETGLDNAQQFAEGLGIKFADDTIDIRDAIGGTGTSVTPVQLAGAFSAFGNEGIYNEPYTVTKVEFPDGKVVDLKPEPKAAMSDYTAYMVTDMLKSVVREGTGTAANIPGLHVAGKTGTTNLEGVEGAPDAWFAGYTTNFTIAVWAGGYEDEDGKRTVMPREGTQVPRALFKHTMEEISKDIETPDFVKPDSVVEVAVEKGTNPPQLPSSYTPDSNIVTELFVKGHEPSQTSEKFDQLDPVNNLKASYDNDENSIHVTWDYDTDDDVSFEISSSIDGGQMQQLSSTEDTEMTITEVERGAEYTIQVIAVKDSNKSEPKQTKVLISDEEEEDDDEDIPSVSDLTAAYHENKDVIEVSWKYNGPAATFEVTVSPNEQTQTVQSNGLEISGVQPGQTYVITVTPIGKKNDNRGDPQTAEVTVPDNEDEPDHADDDEDEDNEDNDDNDNDND
ncbi:MAG TPA: penicillin-binding transpeptidase domain-containing protein, partial [Virgibacillus sp.]|nr:penicillin-binding transpeptidase domain-containing protein [Virgibacillus sp.]